MKPRDSVVERIKLDTFSSVVFRLRPLAVVHESQINDFVRVGSGPLIIGVFDVNAVYGPRVLPFSVVAL